MHRSVISRYNKPAFCIPLIPFLLICLLVAIGVQLLYWLFIFSRTAFFTDVSFNNAIDKLPGVSVIVAAWNELENLQELLPMLDTQQYPDFEVIVVDDRSSDGSYDFLLTECEGFRHVRFIRVDQTPKHITAKKYALTLGIKAAHKDVVLVTDADCRPTSKDWIQLMASNLTQEKSLVLGFSPYYRMSGFLNKFIRFETFYTALQYFSFALVGAPYMGVGRNLLYRKSVFLENKGFQSHQKIMGGDDDLFVNEVATTENVAVCIHPNAFTYSVPKTAFRDWYWQKRRHLSVGKGYRFRNKLMLGLLSLSHILSWSLFLVLLPVALFQLSDPQLISWVGGAFGLRLLSSWVVMGLANRKLGNTIYWISLPLFDFLYVVYYVMFGIITLFSRRKLNQWK